MHIKDILKKTAIGVVAVATAGSTLLGSAGMSFATETQPVAVEEQTETYDTSSDVIEVTSDDVLAQEANVTTETEAVTDVEETETLNEDVSSAEETTSKAKEEMTTEEETSKQTDAKSIYAVDKADTALIESLDFSSMRLIVSAKDDKVFVDDSVIIASYDDIYLLQFDDIKTAKEAYAYYSVKAESVEVDAGISIADGTAAEQVKTDTVMTEEDNPLTELEEALDSSKKATYDIALIDTGANNVAEAVSMIGDSVKDDNGHGNKMVSFINGQNENAKILSIKALDKDGKGDVSAVYAAIQYAVENNVKVINLSISALASKDSSVIEDAVNEAVAKGITVVGAAGNNGKNAALYVPGQIKSAIIAGAADKDGNKIAISNLGDTVDYNVVAESTSEASAKLSGFISKNGIDAVKGILNKGFVFESNYKGVVEEETTAFEEVDDINININKTPDRFTAYKVFPKIEDELFHTATSGVFYHDNREILSEFLLYGNVNGKKYEAYCINNGLEAPDNDTYVDSGVSKFINSLGFLMKNKDEYLKSIPSGEERQFLVSVAAHMIVEDFSAEDVKNSGIVYDMFFGNGNYQAINKLVEDAKANGWDMDLQWEVSVWNTTKNSRQTVVTKRVDPPEGKVTFNKYADPPSLQATFNIEGALYHIFEDQSGAFPEKWTGISFITDKDGNGYLAYKQNHKEDIPDTAKVILEGNRYWWWSDLKEPLGVLEPGTYYYREMISPEGWKRDMAYHAFTVKDKATTDIKTTDEGLLDSIGILLTKRMDDGTGDGTSDIPSEYSLENAEFTIKYYTDEFTKASDAPSKAERSWVFKTNANGFIYYNNQYKKSGDDLYADSNGIYSLPPGTIVIEETKAPTGFIKNDDKLVMTIGIDNNGKRTRTLYDANGKKIDTQTINVDQVADTNVTVLEKAVKGGISVNKIDRELKESSPQGDATLKGAEFTIYDSANKAVATITTDANGNARTGNRDLLSDKYTVKETKAPTGYKLNSSWSATVTIGNTEVDDGKIVPANTSAPEDVIRGGVKLEKWDKELNKKAAQGDADFSGIKFEITNASANPVTVDGKEYAKNAVVMTLTTNAAGDVQTAANALPYGSYFIKEVATNGSYLLTDGIAKSFTIRNDGEIVSSDSFKDNVVRGDLDVTKIDAENKTVQGDAALSGIKYAVVTRSAKDVVVPANGTTYQKGEVVAIITTNAQGKASTPAKSLPYGTYDVYELRADATIALGDTYDGSSKLGKSIYANDKGYLFKDSKKSFTIRTDGETKTADYSNNVVRGGVLLQKVSLETLKPFAQGGATLKGAEFTIYNNSAKEVIVKEKTYKPGEVVMVIKTNENGTATTGAKELPYGSYYAVETKRPEGYLLNKEWRVDFQIREEGVVVDTSSDDMKTAKGSDKSGWTAVKGNKNHLGNTNAATVPDQVARRAFEFEKTLEGVGSVGNCLFEVTQVETGEVHYIMTDPNGAYNSRRFNNNNGNDAAVTKNEDGTYTVDESKLSYKNNVWFSMDSEGNTVEPIDGFDAYPYGTYTFKELRTSVNEGFTLITFTGIVYDDEFYLEKDGNVYNLGTKDDTIPTVGTTAYNDDDRFGKLDSSAEKVTIVDKVEYDNLIIGNKYKFMGKLWDKTNNRYVVDEEGNPVVAWSDVFKAKAKSGQIYMTFEIPGSYVNDTEKVVVFESLFEIEAGKEDVTDKDTPVTEHIDPNDIEQTLPVEPTPEIGTILTGENGEKAITTDGNGDIILKDTVSYSGLEKGKEYSVSGKMYSKEDKDFVAEAEPVKFTPSASKGTVEVEFKVKASDVVEKHLVAFETLSIKGEVVATHEDPEDPDQTVVVIPKPEKKYSDDILKQKDPVLTEIKVVYEKKQIGYDLTWVNDTENTATVEVKDTLSAGITYDKGSAVDEKGNKVDLEVTVNEDGTTTLYLKKEKVESASFGHILYTVTVNSKAATKEEKYQVNNDYDLRVTKEGEDPDKNTWRDINDLHNPVPAIGTTLIDSKTGDHIANAEKSVELKDTVEYKGLQPETEYKVEGKIYNKTTGKLTNITASATFTSSKTGEGTAEVTFKLDATKLAGNSLVAYEYIYDVKTGDLVGKHENPDDPEQTVKVKKPDTPTTKPDTPTTKNDNPTTKNSNPTTKKTTTIKKSTPKTGDANNWLMWIIIAGVAAALGASAICINKLKNSSMK